MNQGRIWCVVNPSVGLPLFLGSVALTSLAVHTSVMTNTTWMSNYWQGSARNRTAEATPAGTSVAKAGAAFSVTVAPSVTSDASAPASFVITVTPNATAVSANPGAQPASSPGLMRSASAD